MHLAPTMDHTIPHLSHNALHSISPPTSSSADITEDIPFSKGLFPFPHFTRKWYKMQGVLSKHNLARGKEGTRNPHQVDSGGVMVYVNRSHVKGVLNGG